MRSFSLSRRALLRGAGAAIALPVLDAMLDGRGRLLAPAGAQGMPPGASPMRLLTFMWPHGVVQATWNPSGTGAGYVPSAQQAALAAVRSDVTIVTNLSLAAAKTASGAGHTVGMSAFANGFAVAANGAGGPSIDQVLAAQFGGATRFRSLALNNDPYSDPSGDPRIDSISWSAANAPVPPDRDPLVVFNRLFGAATSTVSTADQTSVLDHVTAEITRLQSRLGAADRARLDEHLTSVRELERQLTTPATCAAPAVPGSGLSPDLRARAFIDLIVTAFRCDLTRYVAFSLTNGFDHNAYPSLGIQSEHHQSSHNLGASAQASLANYVNYAMGSLAYLVQRLRATASGTTDLLQDTIVMASSEMAHGQHGWDNMPVVLAGRAGGRMANGVCLAPPAGTPMCNLFLTLLQLGGSTASSFGLDGTATLPGLVTG